MPELSRPPRTLLQTLYLGWAFFWFISWFTLLSPVLVLPYYLLPGRLALQISYQAMQWWARVFVFPIGGIRYVNEGQTRLPKGPFIAIANHNSLLDTPAIVQACPRALRFLGKSELARVPWFGIIYRHLVILVNRKDPQSKLRSFLEMKQLLHRGTPILIFPEGSMNQSASGHLQPFQSGAFRLSLETQLPIVPIRVSGTRYCLAAWMPMVLRRGTIKVEFLPPIYPAKKADNQAHDIASLKEAAFAALQG